MKKYMKHPKLKRRKNETDKAFDLRRERDRAKRRKELMATAHTKRQRVEAKLKLDAPLKIVHDWIADRDMHVPHIVLRIDDYALSPADRGQFYPAVERSDDKMKAIWPNRQMALDAAAWAARKFGRQYGVFRLDTIVETAPRPVRTTEV